MFSEDVFSDPRKAICYNRRVWL